MNRKNGKVQNAFNAMSLSMVNDSAAIDVESLLSMYELNRPEFLLDTIINREHVIKYH